ncbi:MAG: heat-inducible transcriptional repressor HrcA [Dehalococcoidia bacterium]|nr:heat-inducible transcriptional repressor HrcA [Dehalococcoidia bacterium]
MLSCRKEDILKEVVAQHIATAQPVASASVARRQEIGVSSATIRHEMAELEQEGYLTHPHTSGGRIPLEKGYRYFVDSLMEEIQPDITERQAILQRFQELEGEVEQWSRLAAGLLARLAGVAGLATPPESQVVRLRRIELILWHDLLALLVLVLQEAYLKHQVLSLPHPVGQEELTAIANKLNQVLEGKSPAEIKASTAELSPLEGRVATAVARLMEGPEQGRRELLWEGIPNILRQPEFSDSRRAGEVLETLEEPSAWQTLIRQTLQSPGVQVVIGEESRHEALRPCSLILSRYGSPATGGVIGILGPTRLQYDRAVGVVRYMTGVLNQLIESKDFSF